jgi:hypothetical protein
MLERSNLETSRNTSMLLGDILEGLPLTPNRPALLNQALARFRDALGADQVVLVLHPYGPEQPKAFRGYSSRDTVVREGAQLSTVTTLTFVREVLKSGPVLKSVERRDPGSESSRQQQLVHVIGVPVLDVSQYLDAPHCCIGVLIADRRHPYAPFDPAVLTALGGHAAELGILLKALVDRRHAPHKQQAIEQIRASLLKSRGNLNAVCRTMGITYAEGKTLLAEAGLDGWHDDLRKHRKLQISSFNEMLRLTRDLRDVADHFDKTYAQLDSHIQKADGINMSLESYVKQLGYDWDAVHGPDLKKDNRPRRRARQVKGVGA